MSDYKKQARSLTKKAKELDLKISYQQSLELIAAINGFDCLAALHSKEKQESILNELNQVAKNIDQNDAFFKEIDKLNPEIYFRMDYFYSRKESGSYYLRFNKKELEKPLFGNWLGYDEELIQLALDKQLIEDASSITCVEEISFDDFLEARSDLATEYNKGDIK